MVVKKSENTEIHIVELTRQFLTVHIVGTTPLICNSMAKKAWEDLLAPKGRKTTAEKVSTMKHNPIAEFRDSPYRMANANAPALLAAMCAWFKQGMGTAALHTPGAKKTDIGRLVSIPDEFVSLYGVPKLFMSIVRNSDMNHTPDVRTRALLPEWACKISLSYITPILRQQAIVTLLSGAGIVSGVGDWRQQKGSGSYGSYKLVGHDDPDYVRIVNAGGRKVQQEALDHPVAYDAQSDMMLRWYEEQLKTRGFASPSAMYAVAQGEKLPEEEIGERTLARKSKAKKPGNGEAFV